MLQRRNLCVRVPHFGREFCDKLKVVVRPCIDSEFESQGFGLALHRRLV